MRWIPCGAPGRDVLVNPAHVVMMRTTGASDATGYRWHRVELVMADGSTVQHSDHHTPAEAQHKLYEIAEWLRA